MLIVIVIIGILAAAIVPKITGVLARARDTKRISDLRNIASAIEMYRTDYGEFPKRKENRTSYVGSVGGSNGLSQSLGDYITEIPKDPQKNNSIKSLYSECTSDNRAKWNTCALGQIEDGEYFYQVIKRGQPEHVMLIAKLETPSLANYVGENYGIALQCSNIGTSQSVDCSKYFVDLCSEVKKGNTLVKATADNTECKYSSEDQLYYIMKIE